MNIWQINVITRRERMEGLYNYITVFSNPEESISLINLIKPSC